MKIFSKITAATMSLMLVATTMTACGAKDKLTFAQTMDEVSNINNAISEVTFKMNSDESETVDGYFKMHATDKDVSLEEIKFNDGTEVNITKPMAYVDNVAYVNLESVWNVVDKILTVEHGGEGSANTLDELLEQYNVDIKKSDIGWVAVPVDFYSEETYSKAEVLEDTFVELFKKTIESSETTVEEQEDGSYKIEIKDAESIKKILTTFKTQLSENKENLITQYTDVVSSVDTTKAIDSMTGIIIETVEAIGKEMEQELTEEDIASIKDSITTSIDQESIEAQMESIKTEMNSQFDTILTSIDDAIAQVEEAETIPTITYIISTTVEKGKVTSVHQEISIVEEGTKNNVNIVVDTKTTEEPVVKPEASKTLPELASFVFSKLKEAGVITDDMFSMTGDEPMMGLDPVMGDEPMMGEGDFGEPMMGEEDFDESMLDEGNFDF